MSRRAAQSTRLSRFSGRPAWPAFVRRGADAPVVMTSGVVRSEYEVGAAVAGSASSGQSLRNPQQQLGVGAALPNTASIDELTRVGRLGRRAARGACDASPDVCLCVGGQEARGVDSSDS